MIITKKVYDTIKDFSYEAKVLIKQIPVIKNHRINANKTLKMLYSLDSARILVAKLVRSVKRKTF